MSQISEFLFADRDSLFAALLQDCGDILRGAIEQRQTATILASGGSTPEPLYRQLSALELPWSKVNVALVDERWVDADHAASNTAFIHRNLLQGRAAAAHFVAMKSAERTALLGQATCEQAYGRLPQPFDLTILGMGPDGHTASLFPGAAGLDDALDLGNSALCAAITAQQSAVTGANTERMSLTLWGLLQSRQLHLLITGAEKLAVYRSALANPDVRACPVSAILQQDKIPVKMYWAP